MTLEDVAAAGALILCMFTVMGAFYRWVLLPNLREQLFKPVQETHTAVTENGGRNNPPTVPDKLHALQTSVDVLTEQVGLARSESAAAAREGRKAADIAVSAATAAAAAAAAATEQRKQIDLAQTVLLEHIKGHEHPHRRGDNQ